jgi:hypothetical protein
MIHSFSGPLMLHTFLGTLSFYNCHAHFQAYYQSSRLIEPSWIRVKIIVSCA